MLEGKKKQIVFFLVIYIVFGAIVSYLLFFNTGLEFVKSAKGTEAALFLQNNSVHLIHNIKITDETGNEIAFFAELQPKEKKQIMASTKGIVKLEAAAPYHISTKTEFVFVTAIEAEIELKTDMPSAVPVGQEFKLKLEICGKSQDVYGLAISATPDDKTAIVGETEIVIDIAEGGCETVEFELKGKEVGNAIIKLGVKSGESSKEIKVKVNIFGSEVAE